VTAYQNAVRERLRQAELGRAAEQARAEEAQATAAQERKAREAAQARARAERRARRLTAGLAAAALLLVLGGGGGVWLWQQHRQQGDAAATLAMNEARQLLEQAKAAPLGDPGRFREALAAAHKAEELAGSGEVRRRAAELVAAVGSEAEAAKRDCRLLAALLEVRGPHGGHRLYTDERGQIVQLAEPSADEQFAAAFRDWDAAFDVDTLSTAEAAARLRSRPPAMRAEVIAALDEWASERRRQRAPRARWRRVADLTAALDDEPRPNRVELRQMLARGKLERERVLAALAMELRPVPVPFDAGLGRDRQRLRRLVEGTDVAAEPALGLLTLARALQAAGDDLLAERLLGAAVQARPHEVAMQHALGRLRAGQGRWREAVECHVAAGALRPELGVDLAEALVKCGQVGEGLALFDYLITAGRSDDPWLHVVHGLALDNVGRWDKEAEAEAAYRQAMRLRGLRLGLAAEGR
jgi:hypothetical protein